MMMNNDNTDRILTNRQKGVHSELLNDIRNFCKDDLTQNVEICCGGRAFNACRFLLCSRSKVRVHYYHHNDRSN